MPALAQMSSPGNPSFYTNPEGAATYIRTLKSAAENAKQGNLELVFATVAFQLAVGGVIAANTRQRAFADNLGQNAASGLPAPPGVTYADANLFFGRCPSGEVIILQGMGISMWRAEAAITDQETELLSRNISVRLNLRNNPVQAGNIACWPTEQGARGTGNGNTELGVRPFDPGVVLLPTEDYTVDFVAERQIALAGDQDEFYYIQVFHPAVRIYDERVLARI